ncbi:hypothetical protein CPB84DRAFT_1961508 [Gymnopilus junonius]|uniref:Uncharacterized protein n=1 Tax=Gymnopilus junonius TaxID=109634 RepID=A0A9P5TNB3_GYMJU|nr:hypothetical protein CPB84DRAFT_1961508 [Gymnopilus junonius]
MLESLPALEQLSLDSLPHFSLSDFTISKLDPSIRQAADAKPFLPNLKEFKFRGHIKFLPTSLIAMLKERLLYSQRNTSDNVPSIEGLRIMDITYQNREWGHSDGSDTNVLRDFHRQMMSLSSLGLTLDIVWEDTKDEHSVA